MGIQSSSFYSAVPKGLIKLHQAIHPTEFEEEKQTSVQLKVASMKAEITRYPLLCVTAYKEMRGAHLRSLLKGTGYFKAERNRITELYEKHIYLQSVVARAGPVACPLGHHMNAIDASLAANMTTTVWDHVPLIKCRICTEKYEEGFRCDYCAYDLCETCAVLYCNEGHVMTLWTHPDAIHACSLCEAEPITSGYTCPICSCFDICDYCSRKEGRNQLINDLQERIDLIHSFFEKYKGESRRATAVLKAQDDFFPTKPITSAMYSQKLAYYRLVKASVVEEVRAKREMTADGIVAICSVRCPAAHSCYPFLDKISVSRCSICDLKICDGHYCVSCDFTLCSICRVISCGEGHAMVIWAAPPLPMETSASVETFSPTHKEAAQANDGPIHSATNVTTITAPHISNDTQDDICSRCSVAGIRSGYCCAICDVKTCDACTSRISRDAFRRPFLREVDKNLAFMEENRKYSMEANKKKWKRQKKMVFISTVGLIAYTKELRRAREIAEIQLRLIPLIEEAKGLRSVVTCHSELCYLSLKEANRHVVYDYTEEEQAYAEIRRLKRLLKKLVAPASPEARAGACVACPLGHGMQPVFLPHVDFSMISVLGEKCFSIESIPPTPEEPEEPEEGEHEGEGTGLKPTSATSGRRTTLIKTMQSKSSDMKDAVTEHPQVKLSLPAGRLEPMPMPPQSRIGASTSIGVDRDRRTHTRDKEDSGTPMLASKQRSFLSPENDLPVAVNNDGRKSLTGTLPHIQAAVTTADESNTGHAAPYAHKIVKHACRACLRGVDEGSKCGVCEYYLCDSCSIFYCRKCHVMRLWTNPDAIDNQCDMCRSPNITSGYECAECNIVVCDMCTRRDNRDALKTWPYGEMKRSLIHLTTIVDDLTKQAADEALKIAELTNSFHIDESALKQFNFPEGMTLQIAALERAKDLDAARYLLRTMKELLSQSRTCSMSGLCKRMFAFLDLSKEVESVLGKDICYSEELSALVTRFEALNELY